MLKFLAWFLLTMFLNFWAALGFSIVDSAMSLHMGGWIALAALVLSGFVSYKGVYS